jgi:hypothetical protein
MSKILNNNTKNKDNSYFNEPSPTCFLDVRTPNNQSFATNGFQEGVST